MALKVGVMQPRNAGSHEQLEEAGSESSQEPLEGAEPCQHLDVGPVKLISDFWLPEL